MTHAALTSLLGPEFDNFLYASINENPNGNVLSVLSAMAQMDVDPWREADKLATLPKETATRRLASLIAALPDEPSAHRPVGAIATRLVALLPQIVDPVAQPLQALLDGNPIGSAQSITIVLLVLLTIAFSGLLFPASSTSGDAAHLPASSGVDTVSPVPPASPRVPQPPTL
jgi:hypothetical protein